MNSNLNMLHGLELLILSFGTGTGNCDIQRKRTTWKTIEILNAEDLNKIFMSKYNNQVKTNVLKRHIC